MRGGARFQCVLIAVLLLGPALGNAIIQAGATGHGQPPAFLGRPRLDASPGQEYVCDLEASDPEGDPLTFSLLAGPGGATIDASTGALRWAPPYPVSPISVQAPFEVGVSDGAGTATIAFEVRVRYPADEPPRISPGLGNLTVKGDDEFDLARYKSDPDDVASNLTWRLDTAVVDKVFLKIEGDSLIITSDSSDKGELNVSLFLEDPSGLVDSRVVGVKYDFAGDLMVGLICIVVMIVLAVLVAILVTWRVVRSRSRRAGATSEGGGGAGPPPVIEELLLIYRDGRLIHHVSREGQTTPDADLMSGMLIAIQGILQTSMRRSGELESIKYGDSVLHFATSTNLIMVAVLKGQPSRALDRDLEATVQLIEASHGEAAGRWTGDPSEFGRADAVMRALLDRADGASDGSAGWPPRAVVNAPPPIVPYAPYAIYGTSQQQALYCTNCGSPLMPTAIFCENCGHRAIRPYP